MNDIERLVELYQQSSKHSNYQVLSNRLSEKLDTTKLMIRSRSEQERLNYLLQKIDFKDAIVSDIGANTGFFTFESLEHGARKVIVYEGNKEHAKFICQAAKVLNFSKQVNVHSEYYVFNHNDTVSNSDITLLLNVLHHIGDDYGDKSLTIEKAKTQIIEQINILRTRTKKLVLQLGFNWKGKIDCPLFQSGTKAEQIDYITNGVRDNWKISSIGVAVKNGDAIEYQDINEKNILRDDSLGEFLNRPIFILSQE